MNCKNCVYNVLKHDSLDGTRFYWCDRYLDSYGQDRAKQCRAYKPKTNADKIRSMTDEDLSQFLCNGIENVFCDLCTKCSCRYAHCKDELCKTNLSEWLEQTVKGE